MRGEHRADGTRVRCAICVPAHIPEYGADIQTSAAADAVQGIPLFGVRKQLGAAVVEHDNAILLPALGVARVAGAPPKSDITRPSLTGAPCRPQRQGKTEGPRH